MNNSRIAIVITNLHVGGAERVAINLANSFSRIGYLVDVVLLSATGELIDELLPEIRVVDLQVKRMREVLTPLIRYIRKNRPNALLANMWPITSITLCACKLAMVKTRLVVVEHTTWSKSEICKSPFRRWQAATTMRFTLPFADGIVAVSDGAADDLARFANLNRNDITVIYNPIVGEVKVTSLHQINDWSESKYPVLAVGKLKVVKDFATLLKAFSILINHLDAKLLILGEGECRLALELQAKQLGISDKVIMPGFVKDTTSFYEQANLCVVTSVAEGFSNVIVESLAAGTPVVSTDCPSGPSEILCNGKFGKLVPVGDSLALAQAMLDSLASDYNRDALISRAQDFSIDKSAKKYIHILLER